MGGQFTAASWQFKVSTLPTLGGEMGKRVAIASLCSELLNPHPTSFLLLVDSGREGTLPVGLSCNELRDD